MVSTTDTEAQASPRLLDARQASVLLSVPASWLLAEARHARIPHVRLGRYVRFHRDTLFAWVAELERGPTPSRNGQVEPPDSHANGQ